MDSECKRQALAEDRINVLPDALPSHILSCIDPKLTKCVVRTSILSKRWKNMWASVPNLYFNDQDFSSSAGFITFVDHALDIRDSSAIKKFDLSFTRFELCAEALSRIDDWISTAVKCHAEQLRLHVNTGFLCGCF
ncbi:PREDICTED: F-box protein At1g19070-like [Fragaria vesca subsp. vesca]|uniref:F-box protein At1g19070-like n=1 Tax=Fragaria vesca subsp. vesca TaxID=101020 RepID=UPI0002C31DE3|nr:PREDICTED: F-box protein At1g19070-like [Fragaria vesca subsp. vesca]